MQDTIDILYEQISDLKTKQEFINEITKRQKTYDNLLDKETIALLLVDELGRNTQNLCKIADIKPGTECTVIGKVTDIRESRTFTRKNGSAGRVINLTVIDETGTCGLVLWDRDVELVDNQSIKIGTVVKVINSYVKEGLSGVEVNLGRWGMLEIEPEDAPIIASHPSQQSSSIKGKLVERQDTRTFFKDDGNVGFVTSIALDTGKELTQLTVWDTQVKTIRQCKIGDTLEIQGIDVRQKNNVTELHLNGRGMIKKV
ncbi:MAG: hypothetical protein JW771_01970 [Candidatus Thermoplasmatota archaeon]|nr:hypothetical protein [Candidatus Thermoplasmatota archaeon]